MPLENEAHERRRAFHRRIAKAAEGVEQVEEVDVDCVGALARLRQKRFAAALEEIRSEREAEQARAEALAKKRREEKELAAAAAVRAMTAGNLPDTLGHVWLRDIIRATSDAFGLSQKDIVGQCRKRRFVWPRQVAMYIARRYTTQSLPQIGAAFEGRDHTTILHAHNKVAALLAERDERAWHDVMAVILQIQELHR